MFIPHPPVGGEHATNHTYSRLRIVREQLLAILRELDPIDSTYESIVTLHMDTEDCLRIWAAQLDD
jgi:hypothetical protein